MPTPFFFRLAKEFNFERRSIGFLERDGDNNLDAGVIFDALNGKPEQTVRTRMDYWLQGGVHDKYFHGWPNSNEYKSCFVFKWDEKKKSHRLYGFLCHPMPISDPGFQCCVLARYAEKAEWETDLTILDQVNQYRQDLRVAEAVGIIYPEYKGRKSWKN